MSSANCLVVAEEVQKMNAVLKLLLSDYSSV